MLSYPKFPENLVRCNVELLDEKLFFLCNVINLLVSAYTAALAINTISRSTRLMTFTKKCKMVIALNNERRRTVLTKTNLLLRKSY